MGLLSKGKPLSWEDTKKYADIVRKIGIQQLVAIYHRMKDRTNDPLKFGDEVWILNVASYFILVTDDSIM